MIALFATMWRTMRTWLALTLLSLIAWLVAAEYAASTHHQLTSLQWQATENSSNLTNLSAKIRNLNGVHPAKLSRELLSLATSLNVPAVLLEVDDVAATSGVTIQDFQFTPVAISTQQSTGTQAPGSNGNDGMQSDELTSPNVKSYPVTVSVSGSIEHVINFISGLEHYRRFTSVQTTTFQSNVSPKSRKVVTANVGFDTYTNP